MGAMPERVRLISLLVYLPSAANGLAPVIALPGLPSAPLASHNAGAHIETAKTSVAGDNSVAFLAPLRGQPPMMQTRPSFYQAELTEPPRVPAQVDIPRKAEQYSPEARSFVEKIGLPEAHSATASTSSWSLAALLLVMVVAALSFRWRQTAQVLKSEDAQTEMTAARDLLRVGQPNFAVATFAGETAEFGSIRTNGMSCLLDSRPEFMAGFAAAASPSAAASRHGKTGGAPLTLCASGLAGGPSRDLHGRFVRNRDHQRVALRGEVYKKHGGPPPKGVKPKFTKINYKGRHYSGMGDDPAATRVRPPPFKVQMAKKYQYHEFPEDGGMYDIIKYPLLDTRACQRLEESNWYTFFVDLRANKPQIRAAFETVFGVKVKKAHTMIPEARYVTKFKKKVGRKAYHKIAFIKLKEGDSIDLFPDDPEVPSG